MIEKCSMPLWTGHTASKALKLELHQRRIRNWNKSNWPLRAPDKPFKMSANSISTSSGRILRLNVDPSAVMMSSKAGSWTYWAAISKASECSSHTWLNGLEPWLKITIWREITVMVHRRMLTHLEVKLLRLASLDELNRDQRAPYWRPKLSINSDQLQALRSTTSLPMMDIFNSREHSSRTS